MPDGRLHDPVMVREVIQGLVHRPDGIYLDGTTGTGGHSEAILQSLGPKGRLSCLDQNPEALAVARARLGAHEGRVHFHRGSFSDLDPIRRTEGIEGWDGILLDLGLNSWLLARAEVGLAYTHDAPLDMRLDPDLGHTAREIVERGSEERLVQLFEDYGDLRRARLYARRIVESRRRGPIATTGELVKVLRGPALEPLAPAELSRIFQALRVAVNEEMERLDTFLSRAADWVVAGGRLAIVAYASHEDRRVKRAFPRDASEGTAFRPLSKKPLLPSTEEVARNGRARSARLRVFERGGTP